MSDDQRKRLKGREAIAQAIRKMMTGVFAGDTNRRTLEREIKRLSAKYGPAEVAFVIEVFNRRKERAAARDGLSKKAELCRIYEEYLERYQIYGGKSEKLSESEFQLLRSEHFKLSSEQFLGAELEPVELRRLEVLEERMLFNCDLWEGIVPPDIPAGT